jgi:OmpA-OmpF porin, OOP family
VRSLTLLIALCSGCISAHDMQSTVAETEKLIQGANEHYGALCAPVALARAQTGLEFAQLEFQQGYLRRGMGHLVAAQSEGELALKISKECGTRDQDNDAIPDVTDRCPLEKEDRDGDRDFDGCRDISSYDDEDGDGIANIDDDCVDEAEDFDNDRDEDGCPETSDDGDGDGFIDAIDKCRDQAEDLDGFMDDDGCPDPDNDQDGILDNQDACMNNAEDLDNWEDEDGCPDPDNDEDGIPDIHDECPTQPGERLSRGCPSDDADSDGIADANDKCPESSEVLNGYLDDDGCPDEAPLRVRVTKTRVEVVGGIGFEEGLVKLLAESLPALDDVVRVLLDSPTMKLRVECHTDSSGSDSENLSLSEGRATIVRRYLESNGIEEGRVTAAGFGETRPIDTNRTESGRARNRRVELHIVFEDEAVEEPAVE